MKEYYNHWLPKLIRVNGIALNTHIFYRFSEEKVTERLRKHETEHVKQYQEDGALQFLFKYLYEYIKNRIKGQSHNEAYLNISYEIEARKAEKC